MNNEWSSFKRGDLVDIMLKDGQFFSSKRFETLSGSRRKVFIGERFNDKGVCQEWWSMLVDMVAWVRLSPKPFPEEPTEPYAAVAFIYDDGSTIVAQRGAQTVQSQWQETGNPTAWTWDELCDRRGVTTAGRVFVAQVHPVSNTLSRIEAKQ